MAVAGSAAAFDALIARHRAKVVRVAYVISRDEDEAEADDIAQAVFVWAYRTLESFGADRAFSRWLLTSARNASTDAMRRMRRAADIAPRASR
ncbi:MAG: sigma-70 family RNA polymerase sigma factor [Candidatus Eremiobacteraeota bacterium]|nr:sigma-70 family RNA polymerase sigma factor [Candidatus Eremiobacteraeota bacterium]MBC5801444.1 sigma-70 family RNA polymerase sigma factor [Candidatus Eremiobacteraeota bacterium]MBC5823209.1 sigma-70 family RNA polymerase sigma factor [Candidatus Eremiobacteraeota bacterium]